MLELSEEERATVTSVTWAEWFEDPRGSEFGSLNSGDLCCFFGLNCGAYRTYIEDKKSVMISKMITITRYHKIFSRRGPCGCLFQ